MEHATLPAAIIAENLHCRRGDRLLIRGLGLRIEAGEALHLIGPNGIGKTSLLRILAGLLPVSKDWSASEDRPSLSVLDIQGHIGFLDGKLALDEHLPLGKALQFWAELDLCPPEQASVKYARMGLDPLLDVPVRFLSTGQRKRACLARLLCQNAQNWLMDEPLNGLDDAGVTLVEDLITEKRGSGGVVIVASHQPIAMEGAQILDLRDHLAGHLRGAQ